MMKPSSAGWVLRGLGRNMPCPLERHTEGCELPGRSKRLVGRRGVARNTERIRQGQSARVPAEPQSSWPSRVRTAQGSEPAGCKVQSANSRLRPIQTWIRKTTSPGWLTLGELLTSVRLCSPGSCSAWAGAGTAPVLCPLPVRPTILLHPPLAYSQMPGIMGKKEPAHSLPSDHPQGQSPHVGGAGLEGSHQ